MESNLLGGVLDRITVSKNCLAAATFLVLACLLHGYHEQASSANYGEWKWVGWIESSGWSTACLQLATCLLCLGAAVIPRKFPQHSMARFRYRSMLTFTGAILLLAAVLLQAVERSFENQSLQTWLQWRAGVFAIISDAGLSIWLFVLGGWDLHQLEWLEHLQESRRTR